MCGVLLVSEAEGRIDLRAPEDFIEQLEEAARQIGMNRSAYLRLAAIEKMARDGLPYKPGKKKSKDKDSK
jgi:uncharacterized protein (DUF1778 family)